jgi:diacylglycerol kinase (ATP)
VIKICFIIHGKHKNRKTHFDYIDACRTEQHFQTTIHYTEKQGDARYFASLEAEKGTEILIAVGGDGTVNEVLNGIMYTTNERIILGILPAGTGNDFVRSISTFAKPQQLVRSILEQKTTSTDVGLIQHDVDHYFLNIADIGFGGKAVEVLNRQRKLFGGPLSYPLAILRTFFGFKKPFLKISGSGIEHQGETFMAAFCNGHSFGKGLVIHPGANPQDGQLNLTLLGKVSILEYLQHLGDLKKGRKITHPEIRYFCGNEFKVTIEKGKASTEADGELINTDGFTITLLPSRLKLLTP